MCDILAGVSDLSLLVGQHEGYPACKNTLQLSNKWWK